MREELITYVDPKSPISEVFKTLRTNIQFMTANKDLKTVLITSTIPSEGKSWVSSNLAVTFAQAGKKVVLVDADMRKGRQYTIFDIVPRPGLSNYLSGMDDTPKRKSVIMDYVQETKIDNLYVIPAGNIPPNPSELLISDKSNEMIKQLKRAFDIIIFDGTPSLIVTDSVILSRIVDATILVTSHKMTKMDSLNKVKKSIENVGGKIAGVVVNKMPISAKRYQDTYYYGGAKTESEIINSITKEEDDINDEDD